MPKRRTHEYTDLFLSDTDLKKINKGRVIIKIAKANGDEQRFAIHPNSSNIRAKRKIAKLEAQIRRLKSQHND